MVPKLFCVNQSSRQDCGRTVLEAVVALTLVALTTVAWSRLEISATRADAYAAHRGVAHSIAVDEIEQLRTRLPEDLGVTAASLGSTTTFEGEKVVISASGVDASEATTVDGLEAEIQRYVVIGSLDSWHRVVVIVTWVEGAAKRSVRLETGVPLLERADPL